MRQLSVTLDCRRQIRENLIVSRTRKTKTLTLIRTAFLFDRLTMPLLRSVLTLHGKTKIAACCCLLISFFALPCALAFDIPLSVRNRESVEKRNEPVTGGVPFSEGTLQNVDRVRLLSEGAEIPAQLKVTARWPDGSVRWALIDSVLDLPADAARNLTLQTGMPPAHIADLQVSDTNDLVSVNSGTASFSFNKRELVLDGRQFQVRWNSKTFSAVPDRWAVEEQGPVKVALAVEGRFFGDNGALLRDDLISFKTRMIFYRGLSSVRVFLTLKNNNSFGWDRDLPNGRPSLIVGGAFFGSSLLPDGEYTFGSGVEKTWEVLIRDGTARTLDYRYSPEGMIASGFSQPHPLLVANPEYYAATRAFGQVTPPIQSENQELQSDLDLYEKIQRAKVIQADVQDPPGKTGMTAWGHLFQDIRNWNHYGGLKWGGDFGPVSDNHYDWSYGMYLQFMRTGLLPFADAARVFARHEIDFAIYHTNADGQAYNYQKNWESRPSDDSPANDFGPGRPSHTWLQGYALHWLLTGDPRGLDAVDEVGEGIRQYVYESFNGEGYIRTRELRVQGWLTENLITLWRINPDMHFETSQYSEKTIPQVIKDVLQSVFDFEAQDGAGGYVYDGGEGEADRSRRAPLMVCYFIEPAIRAYDEVFEGHDAEYSRHLLALISRMTEWLMSETYGGVTNSNGEYLPLQIPYSIETGQAHPTEGQIPYLLMSANAAGFMYKKTGDTRYIDYARRAFRDYVRYLGVTAGDAFIDPALRTAASYNSSVYVDTESKVHGWGNRYGQYYLASESGTPVGPDVTKPKIKISSPRRNSRVARGRLVRGTASDNLVLTRVENRISGGKWKSFCTSRCTKWKVRLPRISARRITFSARAIDAAGNISTEAKRAFRRK